MSAKVSGNQSDRQFGCAGRSREPEVDDDRFAAILHDDVFGFEIAMNHAAAMDILHRLGEGANKNRRLVLGQRAAYVDVAAKRFSLDQSHRHKFEVT